MYLYNLRNDAGCDFLSGLSSYIRYLASPAFKSRPHDLDPLLLRPGARDRVKFDGQESVTGVPDKFLRKITAAAPAPAPASADMEL